MYETHFGLEAAPFHITPDPRFIYMSKAHRDAFNHLLYGTQMRKGFLALIGEVGMGKTTLYRHLLEELGAGYPTAVVLNPILTAKQLLISVLRDFGALGSISNATTETLINRLNLFLEGKNREDQVPLLVVDEAHQLSDSLLELLRVLSNFETNQQKLLQILLVGQPELLNKLSSQGLRQLNQRINIRYFLGRLEKDEIDRYVQHRLSVAGSKGTIEFSRSANRIIRKYSRGVPRVINQISDRALLSAFVQDSRTVCGIHVKEAISSLRGGCYLSPLSFLKSSDSKIGASGSFRRLESFWLSGGARVGTHT